MSERRFNPAQISKLESAERYKHFPPIEILNKLGVKDGDTILDIGAGTGYFTFPAAEYFESVVYALDIEPKMLEIMERKIVEKKVSNIKLIQGSAEGIPLHDEEVDLVIASMVLHEVDPLSAGIKEIYRVLKPGGHCICLEWMKRDSKQGPPLNHRIHHDDMSSALKKEGFTNIEISFPSGSVYIITFKK